MMYYMKNVFLIMFLLILNNIYSLELWNGFMVDMTKEQVYQRIRTALTPVQKINERNGFGIWGGINGIEDIRFAGYNYSIIELLSEQEQFKKDNNIQYFFNIEFQFYKNKLFGIKILWNSRLGDLVNIGTRNYGSPRFELGQRRSGLVYLDSYWYYWFLEDKTIILNGSEDSYMNNIGRENVLGSTYVFDHNKLEFIRRDNDRERVEIERQTREREERERMERLNNTNF